MPATSTLFAFEETYWNSKRDHYRNLEAYDRAMEFYRDAVRVLEQKSIDPLWKEDVEEIRKAVSPLTQKARVAKEAREIEKWCTQALRA